MKDVRSGLRASLAMAVCALLLAPAAAADNGKNPREEHPGNSATAPGQEKKNESADAPEPAPSAPAPPAEPPPPSPSPPPPPAPGPEQAAAPATSPATTQQPSPSGRPAGSHGSDKPKPPRPAAQPPPAASGSAGERPGEQPRESTAHDKVLVCHATGSATNPYVVISISVNAWSRGSGHGSHSGDVFIDWSWPGDPRQKDDSLCPSRAPETPTTTSNETPAGPQAPTSVPAATTTPAAGAVAAVASPAAAAGQRSESADPASWSRTVRPSGPASGVLATTSRLSRVAVRGALPFTGVPLWGVALAGLGLIGLGIPLVRRSGCARPTR